MPLGEIEDDLVGELSHGTAIAVVLCVALLMGVIVLIIGAVGLLARRCRRRRPLPSSINAEMIKTASGHEYGVDEPLELRTAPVVDGSDYVTRVLCTGCGRDFDVLHSDSAGYAPVISAHAHGTPNVGSRSFAGCRSLSVMPLEPELPRRGGGSVSKSTRKSSFQTVPSWGVSTDCGGTCSCPGTSSMSDACMDSTSATCGRSARDAVRTCDVWRSGDDTHLSLS